MKSPISFSKDTSYVAMHTPLGGVTVHKEYRWQDPWFFGRGDRLGELRARLPLPFKHSIEFNGPYKSYRELVGAPKYLENLDWILDEFDSSFNDLASASLRYHLDFSVCDNEERRDLYEDLIKRLNEEHPEFTDEELGIIHARDTGNLMTDINRENTPEEKAVYDAYWKREEEYHERIKQARHDFVDVMRGLWS